MDKLIKCHFYYLMNKLMIVVFLLTIAAVIFFSLFTVLSFDERTLPYMLSSDYYLSIYEVIKLVMFILVIFLFGYSFILSNDGYNAIIIGKDISRTKYFISKTIVLFLVFSFIYIAIIAFSIVIGLAFDVFFSKTMLKSFIFLYILLMIYGELSIILVLVFDNIYIVFITIPLSLISYDKTIYFLAFILPLVVKSSTNSFSLPWWYYLFEIVVLYITTIILFNRKDLSN